MIYGDVTNPDVLEQAGVRTSAAVVLTIPDEEAVMRACTVIRRLNPAIFIAGRTNYLNKAMALYQCGADHVVIEEVATALAMEREVLAKLRERGIAGRRTSSRVNRAAEASGLHAVKPERPREWEEHD